MENKEDKPEIKENKPEIKENNPEIKEDNPFIELIEKKYNQKEYNKRFNQKNKEKVKMKHICDICLGSYTYFNKSKHFKSLRHLAFVNKLNIE